ncbi:MAG: histidine phosphatase family protein [Vicinamibacterales bacterium]
MARVYLLHHAEALGPDVDPQRPLSSRGLEQAAWVAAEARARGVLPAAIWHSGKLRARQTAEAVLRACQPMAEFRMIRGLRPDDPPAWLLAELGPETRDVVLAGHRPHLPALARAMAGPGADVPLHGLTALERREDGHAGGGWVELWRIAPPDA